MGRVKCGHIKKLITLAIDDQGTSGKNRGTWERSIKLLRFLKPNVKKKQLRIWLVHDSFPNKLIPCIKFSPLSPFFSFVGLSELPLKKIKKNDFKCD